MKHIQKNDFINNIKKIKKEIESTIFRFNLESLGSSHCQINFKTNQIKVSNSNLTEKIKPIADKSNELITDYNNAAHKELSMEIIKKIILDSFKNVNQHYDYINNFLNPDINKLPEKSLKICKKYKIVYEKTIDKLIEKTNNFLKLLTEFVEYSKNLKNQIINIEGNLNDIVNKEIISNGIKSLNKLYSEFSNFVECFEKYKEYLDKIKDFFSKTDIFNNLESIIKKINALKDSDKLDTNSIIKKINFFDKTAQINECIKNLEINYNITEKIKFNILFVFDITSSMEKHIRYFEKNFDSIFEKIKKNCHLSLIYTGFIGYKDINDLELGDEYVDIEFTLFHNKLKDQIKNIQAEGGDDIPEDVAGAFGMALNKKWNNGTNILFLVTDAPCHGTKYHDLDQRVDNLKDNFRDEEYGDYKIEKIEKLVEKIVVRNFNLICLDINHNNTKKMFKMFEDKYKEKNKEKLFSISDDNFDKCVVNKVIELYNRTKEEIIKEIEVKKNN